LEELFVDSSTDLTPTSPYKPTRESRDPVLLLEDLQTLYLSSSNTPSLQSQDFDTEEEDLWSASQLHRSLKKKKQSEGSASSTTADYESELQNIMNTTWNTNAIPNMADHNNLIRAKTYTNSSRYNRQEPQVPVPPPRNAVDLSSMYYEQPSNFYQPYHNFQAFNNPNMFNNSTEQMNNGQYMPFNQQPYSNQYQNNARGGDESGMNPSLNPYATEFNPFSPNQPKQQHAQHYKEEFSTDYSNEYRAPVRHAAPIPIRQASEESNPVIDIPEGAVTLTMPQIYLGKFMMNRTEYESKYSVNITTNSKDGGYLIIITGERAAEAGADVEKMWKEEPITSCENITEGKHIIKVAPDRYEGVVCVPLEYYNILLAKRNQVESKHKVRILVVPIKDHNRYRAVIRANKKQTATEAADDLETLVMSSDPAAPAEPASTS